MKNIYKMISMSCYFGICLFILSTEKTLAQLPLTPDNSLGSQVTPNQQIRGVTADLIEGGASLNDNLFHSFSEFNVNELQNVYFANPTGINNILTRVTGNNSSNINGTLGVDGNANLFLINPQGILFGNNAKLDLNGSFLATTAEEVLINNNFVNIGTASKDELLNINPNVFFTNALRNSQINQNKITLNGVVNSDNVNSVTLSTGEFINNSGNFNINGDLIFNLNAVTPQTQLSSTNINNAINAMGNNVNSTIINLFNPEGETATFAGETININKNVTIQAHNPAIITTDDNGFITNIQPTVILDGENSREVVTINNAIVNLNNLGIKNGSINFEDISGIGGGININEESSVTINNSLISNNFSYSIGGGINNDNSNLTLNNSQISDNFSINAGGINNNRGINNNNGKLIINNSLISHNLSSYNTGGISNNGDLIINNSQISDNFSQDTGGISNNGDLTVNNSIISNNSAGTGTGGIRNNGNANLSHSSVINNNSQSIGGIYNTGNLNITNSNISDNSGNQGGGINNSGYLKIINSNLSHNEAIFSGGAIDNNGNLNITNSNIFDNSANQGGAISNSNYWLHNDSGNINIENSSIFNNSANQGGAIYNNATNIESSIILNNTIFNNNTSVDIFSNEEGIQIFKNNQILNNFIAEGGILKTEGNVTINANSLTFQDTNPDTLNNLFGINNTLILNTPELIIQDSIINTSNYSNFSLSPQNPQNFNIINSTISTNGNNLTFSLGNASLNLIDTDINSNSNTKQSGTINISNSGNINLNNSRIFITSEPGINLTGGDLNINTNTLNLTNFSLIDTSTYSEGNAGNININATNMNLNQYSIIRSLTTNQGNAGDIFLNINNAVNLDNLSIISTAATVNSSGNSGNINLNANSLALKNGSQLQALTQGSGQAGSIFANINQDILISGFGTENPTTNPLNLINVISNNNQIGEILSHDTLATAQLLTNSNFGVNSLDNPNQNVEFSTRIPYTSIEGNGDNTVDIYSFEVKAGTRMVFDIDISEDDHVIYHENTCNGPMCIDYPTIYQSNLKFTLLDSNGNILASNDNAVITLGGEGSSVNFDPYLKYTFSEGGIYYLKVTGTDNNGVRGQLNNANILGQPLSNFVNISADNTNLQNNIIANVITSLWLTDYQDNLINLTIIDNKVVYDPYEFNSELNLEKLAINNFGSDILNIPAEYNELNNLKIGLFQINILSKLENNNFTSGDIWIYENGLKPVTYNLNISAETPLIEGIGSINNITPSGIFTSTSGVGNAGNITLNSATLNIQEGGEISAKTSGSGNGGTININANNYVNVGTGVENFAPVITVETSNSGQAGNINLNTPNFTLSETARITATATETATNLQGGGSINLSANNMNLAGIVGIFAETKGQTPAGTLLLQTYQNNPDLNINLFPNSKISASTFASGNGGNLIVTAPNSITINGAGILAVETSGSGNAGNILMTTNNLNLTNGVTVSASTSNSGNAGNINVNVNNLNLTNNSTIQTNTLSSGNAGNIKLTVADNLNITDSQILATTGTNSTGNGGNIDIDPINTNLTNSTIAVSSQGQGIGGNINLVSNFLTLDNSDISAETFSSDGGNINLNLTDIFFLKNGSNISTTAGIGSGFGNGGNINIIAPFIIALPNQDNNITANAFQGQGGNINITTNALFGISFTGDNINIRNDITASSKFGINGTVIINIPAVDPTSGLINLPENLVDASSLIDQNFCQESIAQDTSFTILGRGGFPSDPSNTLNPNNTWEDWRLVANTIPLVSNQNNSYNPPINDQENLATITPAKGWGQTENGDIILTAQVIPINYENVNLPTLNCNFIEQ